MKFCKVADIADWQSDAFQATAALLQLDHLKTRKSWEFIQVYTGLQQLGLLNGQAIALGLGVGHEPLVYAFANVCQQVVATDLYESADWSTAAMATQEVYERNGFPYARDRLTVRHMDMTQIEYPENTFDFIWSCCAIEHVNNFEALYQVYQEIHRVLKPGGVAALTTEFNATDQPSYDPNMLFTDRHWVQHWLTGSNPLIRGFEIIDAIDYSLTSAPDNAPVPRRTSDLSMQVYCNDVVLNSISFFLRKTSEFAPTYDSAWLDSAWRTYIAACDAYRHQDFPRSEQLLQDLLQTEIPDRLRFRAWRRLADALFAQGNLEGVKTVCQTVAPHTQEINDDDHILPLAHYCRKVGLINEALAFYRRVADLPGALAVTIGNSYRFQAQCLKQQGHYQQALTLVQQAEAYPLDETTHQLQFLKGSCYQALGQFEEAIHWYEQASTLAPESEHTFRERCTRAINKCLQMQLNQTRQQLTQLQNSRILRTYDTWRSAVRSAKRWLRFPK